MLCCCIRRHKLLATLATILITTGVLFTLVYTFNNHLTSNHKSSSSKIQRDLVPRPIHQWSLSDRKKRLQGLAYRFPRIMIIGFGKAGTRALYEALKLHPRLKGAKSEQRFFSRHYSKGLMSYLLAQPNPPIEGINIEKSPDYIIDEHAPKRLQSALTNLQINSSSLKFIVVLRDPIERAVSEYVQWSVERSASNGPSLPPLPKMILDRDGAIDTSVPYINASCYAYHIKNWLRYFPREQLCFVDGDKFKLKPFAEIHQLEECLGLEEYFKEQNFVYNSAKGFYCFLKSELDLSEPHCLGKSKGRKHPKLPQSTVEQLQSFFKPWNNQLQRIIT